MDQVEHGELAEYELPGFRREPIVGIVATQCGWSGELEWLRDEFGRGRRQADGRAAVCVEVRRVLYLA